MASATVRLKEGKSYTYTDGPNQYKFTESPSPVQGRDLIDRLKTISQLLVDEHVDAPVVPLKPKAGKAQNARGVARMSTPPPLPEPEPEPEEPEDEEILDEELPADEEVLEETSDEVVDDDNGEVAEVEEEPAPEPDVIATVKPKAAKGGKPGKPRN